MLKAKNLGFLREDLFLFRHLNFELHSGELMHLHGKNGIGKSTLLKVIAGLLVFEEGSLCWNESSLKKIWDIYCNQRFYLGHELALKENFSVIENLKYNFFLDDSMIKANQDLWNNLDLLNDQHKKIYELSAGLKKKLSLSRLHFMISKKFWILDEPFISLDKRAIQWLEKQILSFIKAGGMVLMTSHHAINLPVHHHLYLGKV